MCILSNEAFGKTTKLSKDNEIESHLFKELYIDNNNKYLIAYL
jgi:hypothetical protein